jgi:molybdate transport system ATP-binding protein
MIEIDCRLRRGPFQLEVNARLDGPATGLFGRSGCGKTSLLLGLAGLLPVEHLRLKVAGQTLIDTAAGLAPPTHRRGLGLVFQDHRLFPHRTIAANLRYGRRAVGGGPSFDEVVELLDIEDLLPRLPALCSGGERQRVALGRALLSAPRMLMLDEPLAGLDRGLKRQVLPYLRRVRERFDLPMLMVSHDLGELLAVTDELLLIEHGRVAGQGSLVQLASRADTLELLHDCGLVFALPGEVQRRDEDGLTWVRPDGESGELLACGNCQDPVGARVEVLLRPEDVILARPPLDARLSVTNSLPGRIAGVARSSARCLVTVDCGLAVPMLAEVTERAVRDLELAVGAEVLVLYKAQAVRTRGLSRLGP